jgi:hypothetical protein
LTFFLFINKKSEALDAAKLKIQAGELRSFAAESKLIVEQALDGRLTEDFFHVHSVLLKDNSDKIVKALTGAPPQAGLEQRYADVVSCARDVAAETSLLSRSWGNQQAMTEAKSRLVSLAAQLEQIETSLGQNEQ